MGKLNKLAEFIHILESGDDIEKGKPAQLGEVRTWNGRKVKKTSQGWVPVSNSKEKGDESENKKDGNKSGDSDKPLSEHAKEASEQQLQETIKNSPDEELRKQAHEELDRRQKEEAVQEEEDKKGSKGESEKKKEENKVNYPKEFRSSDTYLSKEFGMQSFKDGGEKYYRLREMLDRPLYDEGGNSYSTIYSGVDHIYKYDEKSGKYKYLNTEKKDIKKSIEDDITTNETYKKWL